MEKNNRSKTFTAWLKEFHLPTLAKELGVDSATVYMWAHDESRSPQIGIMRRIKEYSKGVVTYEMMIDRK